MIFSVKIDPNLCVNLLNFLVKTSEGLTGQGRPIGSQDRKEGKKAGSYCGYSSYRAAKEDVNAVREKAVEGCHFE